MERLSFSFAKSVTKTLEDGTSITAQKIEKPRVIPGSVAVHEAAHVVAAGEIVNATIIPSGNAKGKTHPVKMTAAAAAAPEALGHSGTGWDMFLTEHVLGVDPGIAKSAARSALSGREEEMHEVASILQERKIIAQNDVEEARQRVKNRKAGVFPVQIEILSPDGKSTSYITNSFRHEVKISDLQKAA